ncbi:MAG: MFS transporter [Chloroflexota bacterium]|nr:MFS transporter [Chloroflexota bacterium]
MASLTHATELAGRLDRLRLSPFHWRLLILSGLGWMFDAMDILIVASVAAAAAGEWVPGQTPEASAARASTVALITSANTGGLFFGALISGWLADRIGRKQVFQLTLLIYSLCTGLSALAPTPEALAAVRFVAGLGLGGELPVASTLVSEFAPAARRGFLVVLLESFWAYGTVLAALIGSVIIGQLQLSWRIAFAIGALPALYVFVLRRALPESPRLLISQGRYDEAEAIVARVEQLSEVDPRQIHSPSPPVAALAPANSARARVADLFGAGLRSRTAVLWLMWATMNFSYYGIFLWLPSQFVRKGFSLQEALWFNLIIAVAQIPGYFSAAWLVEWLGRKLTLAAYLVMAGVGSFFFGQHALEARDVGQIIVWGSVISFFNLGAWGVVYTYTPELYPTWLRGTGAGWAAACGRVFAFLAPLSLPTLLALAGRDEGVFLVFTAVMVVGGLIVVVFGPETRGRSLEQASASALA